MSLYRVITTRAGVIKDRLVEALSPGHAASLVKNEQARLLEKFRWTGGRVEEVQSTAEPVVESVGNDMSTDRKKRKARRERQARRRRKKRQERQRDDA